MERLVVYVDQDPAGLTPHYAAHTFVGGTRHEGGWWRTPEKAIDKLVAAIAPAMLTTAVLRVDRYSDALDPRLAMVVDPNPEIPIGSIITRAAVAEKCTRCGHYECPCCTTWCDACLIADDDDWTRDGDWWVRKDDPTVRIHVQCEAESVCMYPPIDAAIAAEHAAIRDALYAATRERWPHGGCSNVTDDGRLWCGPSLYGSSEWNRMSSDMRAVRRAEALVFNANHGRTRRPGFIANLDADILEGLLHLAAAAYDPNAIRRATLTAAIDDTQVLLDKEPLANTDVRYGLALAIAALGNRLAQVNEPVPPPVQGSDAEPCDEPLPETLPEATEGPADPVVP